VQGGEGSGPGEEGVRAQINKELQKVDFKSTV
jgi:hypothetical protein